MQGGIVIFTSEFEAYIKEKLGAQANFMRIFKAWWAEKPARARWPL